MTVFQGHYAVVFQIPASSPERTREECSPVRVCRPVVVHSAQLLLSGLLTRPPDTGFLHLGHCKGTWATAQGARSCRRLPAPGGPPSEWRPGVSAVGLRFLPFPPFSLCEGISPHSPLSGACFSGCLAGPVVGTCDSCSHGRELRPMLSVEIT